LIEITLDQLYAFTGNMLLVKNEKGEEYLLMSASARQSLTALQVSRFSKFYKILAAPIPTIEKYGGGSVRCMLAAVMLPFINSNN